MKKIKGFEDYLITIFGDIYSMKSNKWLKPDKLKNGYLRVVLTNNEKTTKKLFHRLVAITFISNPDNKPEVNHKNGNKQNNFIDNLEWVTKSENTKHAYKYGLMNKKGENNSMSKLNNNEIYQICGLQFQFTQIELGYIFKISRRQINNILNGKRRNDI